VRRATPAAAADPAATPHRRSRPRLLRKPCVVVAGQTPPPVGGQAVMIARLRDGLAASGDFDVAPLPFFFTRHVRQARRPGARKLLEVVAVLRRLRRLRARGPIDLLLYPVGGPQRVPLVRDLLLLPWCRLAARRLVLHFHAAGIADALDGLAPPLRRLVRALYRRADAALVMTEYGRRDPEAVGVRDVRVVPLSVPDELDPLLVARGGEVPVLLYVGHLCEAKGTPALLEAAALLRAAGRRFSLRLAGEPHAPYTPARLAAEIRRLALDDVVERCGVVTGLEKARLFGTADLLVFPTVAPYESFGLVMVEAMMWGLPVVATDWRGNREVLGEPPGGRCYPPGADHAAALAAALGAALDERTRWPAWGVANRRRYEQRFRDDGAGGGVAAALRELLA
jgi:glycosyltransferase involved in cell wall biosynthesis